jgi:hypothetical protein
LILNLVTSCVETLFSCWCNFDGIVGNLLSRVRWGRGDQGDGVGRRRVGGGGGIFLPGQCWVLCWYFIVMMNPHCGIHSQGQHYVKWKRLRMMSKHEILTTKRKKTTTNKLD